MKAFTMTPDEAHKAYEEYQKLCQMLDDENNLAEIKEMAKRLDIPITGRKKREICSDIGATASFFQEKPKDMSAYEMYLGDQDGGKRRKRHHPDDKVKNPLSERYIQRGGMVHRKLVRQGVM